MKWINVKDKIPSTTRNLIVYAHGRVEPGTFFPDDRRWYTDRNRRIHPTHWMPLPDPPETE